MLTNEREAMPYTVYTTNQPDEEKVIEENEFIDLQRMGLLVAGKGDLGDDGLLKPKVAKEAPVTVTGVVPGSLSTPGVQASSITGGDAA